MQTCCDVVAAVYALDPGAVVMPEAGVLGGSTKRVGNRLVPGPEFYVDVLGALGSGQVFAIEVDGHSHDNGVEQARDNRKQLALIRCRVNIFRVDIRDVQPESYAIELHKFRQFIRGLQRISPWEDALGSPHL